MKVKRILSNLCIGVLVFSSVVGNVQAENNDYTNEKEVSKSEVGRVTENDDERIVKAGKFTYPADQGEIIKSDDKLFPIYSGQTSQDTVGNKHLSWGIATMQIDVLADYVKNSTDSNDSIIVAVVDSGISADHPLLQGKVLNTGYDYVNKDSDPSDDYGHGTHVAGIIADCTQGLNVKILPEKVLNAKGRGHSSNIANGIRNAVDQGAKVINYSISGAIVANDYYIDDAIDYALNHGVVVVAASGNANTDATLSCPGHRSDIIITSAIDENMMLADWGEKSPNYGNTVDVSESSYFANAAVWNYQNGIITGQNGKLGVGNNLLRQDFANILYRYASYKGVDVSQTTDLSHYPDGNKVSPWATTAVEWAVANGLMGQNVSELKPLDNINRAEIATIISRFVAKFNL